MNTFIARPSPEAIAQAVAALNQSLDRSKLLGDLCKPAALRVFGESNMAKAARDALASMRQACGQKDAKGVHDAYLQYLRIDAGACELTTMTSQYVFERKDLNKSTSVEQGPESCPGTLTQTLWREGDRWNFKSSRTFLPSPAPQKYPLLEADCAAAAKALVSEWSWKYRNPRDAGCEIIKM